MCIVFPCYFMAVRCKFAGAVPLNMNGSNIKWFFGAGHYKFSTRVMSISIFGSLPCDLLVVIRLLF